MTANKPDAHELAVKRVKQSVVELRKMPEASSEDLQRLCSRLTGRAVSVLASIMEDQNASVSARVTAATTILDRAHGKPAQTVNQVSTDLTALHLAALKQHAEDQQRLRSNLELKVVSP